MLVLPRPHRLTRPRDFTAVLRGGRARTRRSGDALLTVYRRSAPDRGSRPARAGLIVSKSVGNSVVRHRVTRRLRHLLAVRLPQLAPGTDLVVRAHPASADADSRALGASLDKALEAVAR